MAPIQHALHDRPIDVEAEVARAAKLLLDLDRFADRLRDGESTARRLPALDARLAALRRLIGRLADTNG